VSDITDSIVVFGVSPADENLGPVASDHLLSGDPQHSTWNYYNDSSGQYRAGVWESTVGKWHAFAGRNEFCYMLSGRVRLSDREGNSRVFGAGDSFVIKPEFNGTWEVLEDARKLYVIFQPEGAGSS
jgi:uncharacterized cupin superfamily protein